MCDADAREVFFKLESQSHIERRSRVFKSNKKDLMANVRRHARRKGWRTSAALAEKASEHGSSTGSPSDCSVSAFSCVRSPLQRTEIVYRAITGYFNSGFESGLWYHTDPDDYLHSRKGSLGQPSLHNVAHVVEGALNAGCISTAIAFASQICSAAKIYLQIEDFEATMEIVMSARTLTRCDTVLARTVVKNIADISGPLYGAQHPLSVLTQYLSYCNVTTDEETEAFQSLITFLATACARHLSETHHEFVDLQYHAVHPDERLVTRLRHLLVASDDLYGLCSLSSRYLMDRLAGALLVIGHFKAVSELTAAMRHRATLAKTSSVSFGWCWRAASVELYSCETRADFAGVEVTIRGQLLPLTEEEHADSDEKAEILITLLNCLKNQAKSTEAQRIQCELDELTSRLPEDLALATYAPSRRKRRTGLQLSRLEGRPAATL